MRFEWPVTHAQTMLYILTNYVLLFRDPSCWTKHRMNKLCNVEAKKFNNFAFRSIIYFTFFFILLFAMFVYVCLFVYYVCALYNGDGGDGDA